jgi:hypothetical protein
MIYETALYIAVTSNDLTLVRLLLQISGINVNLATNQVDLIRFL